MKFKSPIISDASGSIGGATFSKNKGGLFIRAKIKGTNPQSDAQTAQRGQFSTISATWRTLTDDQRAAWEAATPYFPYQDKLGQTKNYSGAQLYSKLNGGIRSASPSASLLVTPPAPVSIPTLTVTGFAVTNGSGNMALTGTFAPTTVPADCVLMVYTTSGLSAGISSPQNSTYKLLGRIAASANIATQLAVLDGGQPTAALESKVFLSMTLISTVSGQMSEVLNTSAIVEGA